MDKGVYLVRRKNSVDIKEAKGGSEKKSAKLTDIIPFGEYNIGKPDEIIDRRSVLKNKLIKAKTFDLLIFRPRSALGDAHAGTYFTDDNYPKGFFDKATSVAEMIKK